ncbi:maturation of Asn-linked oligosaccharides protein [Gryganskiella cystojenkinii]|nr:maturation of Asn-linked oligosaccharides protein [Gryganskiella cystojenkinii]
MRLAVLAILAFFQTTLGQIQKPGLQQLSSSAAKAAEVKELFQICAPINDNHGWGLTIIRSMSTMYVMGLNDLFADAVAFVANVDFSKVPADSPVVTITDTSIKYLGGLLSAYELSQKKNPVLLQKAQQLGDKLAYAWVSEKDIPFLAVNFVTNAPTVDEAITISDATGMLLEFNRLSNFTGNTTYYDLARKSVLRICKNPAPLPGLPAKMIDPSGGGVPVGGYVSFDGGSNDYYYGLLRMIAMQSEDSYAGSFRGCWKNAVDTAIATLLKTSTVGDWTYLADLDKERKIRHVSSQQACFAGGDWILGGKLFNSATVLENGLGLTDACINTYTSTNTNLGPESIVFISSDSDSTVDAPPTPEQKLFSDLHGFILQTDQNILASLKKYTQLDFGMTRLSNVMDTSGGFIDDTNVSLFSGVLKYLYLTFDDPNNYSLDK